MRAADDLERLRHCQPGNFWRARPRRERRIDTVDIERDVHRAVAHPFAGNDIYTYYGEDRTYANAWTSGATQGGWGNVNFLNTGCLNQSNSASAGAFNTPIAGSTCTFDVQKAQEFTIGFWQDAYKGNLGRLRYGLQYEYVRLTAFPGAAGPITPTSTPNEGLNPNNNILMFSFRYYPFN